MLQQDGKTFSFHFLMSIKGSLVAVVQALRPNTAPARLGQSQLSFRGETDFPSSFVQVKDDSDDCEGGDAASGGDQRHVGVSLGGGDAFPKGSAGSDAAVQAETASQLVKSARISYEQQSPRWGQTHENSSQSSVQFVPVPTSVQGSSSPRRGVRKQRPASPKKLARSQSHQESQLKPLIGESISRSLSCSSLN